MPYLDLGQAKRSSLKNIAGVCPDSDEFLSLLNDATRELMDRGHWFGTVRKIQGCIYNRTITWPRYVGLVRSMTVGNCVVPMANHWHGFLPLDGSDYGRWCRCDRMAYDDNLSPVFNQIECNEGMYVRHYPTVQEDKNKTVTIFGIDTNGQALRHKNSDGVWEDGMILTTAIPFSSTSTTIRRVTRVLLDEMEAPSRLYQYDADNDVLLDMAYYEAGETSPMYRQTKLQGACYANCCNGKSFVTALIDLQFVPVKYDSDLIQIENIDALKLMMQAIKSGEQYDHEESEKAILRAVKRLNLELFKKYPIEQIPVNINPFGTAPLSHAGIGRIL